MIPNRQTFFRAHLITIRDVDDPKRQHRLCNITVEALKDAHAIRAERKAYREARLTKKPVAHPVRYSVHLPAAGLIAASLLGGNVIR